MWVEEECYRLGEVDAAQDRSAGVSVDLGSFWGRFRVGTGAVFSVDMSPEGEPRAATLWTEPGVVVAGVVLGDRYPQNPCGLAYLDGYRGVPFQPPYPAE